MTEFIQFIPAIYTQVNIIIDYGIDHGHKTSQSLSIKSPQRDLGLSCNNIKIIIYGSVIPTQALYRRSMNEFGVGAWGHITTYTMNKLRKALGVFKNALLDQHHRHTQSESRLRRIQFTRGRNGAEEK